ncbi:MAG: ribosomal protein S18-alanine N-acetyltransferase [Polyangiaceae bacterium]|nr:ribosomal protein S18-alanine N-acetyltransferase [Polyangiaceae bacterium]
MQISRLTPADHSAVLEIAAEAATPVEADELTRDVAHVWVARANPDEVAGFLLAWAVADEVHLINIATRQRLQRQGVGQALMVTLLDFAAQMRARLIVLEVRRSNAAAIRLYRSNGFCAIGVRRGYYADSGEDAVEMMVTLDPESGEVQPGRDEINLSA